MNDDRVVIMGQNKPINELLVMKFIGVTLDHNIRHNPVCYIGKKSYVMIIKRAMRVGVYGRQSIWT